MVTAAWLILLASVGGCSSVTVEGPAGGGAGGALASAGGSDNGTGAIGGLRELVDAGGRDVLPPGFKEPFDGGLCACGESVVAEGTYYQCAKKLNACCIGWLDVESNACICGEGLGCEIDQVCCAPFDLSTPYCAESEGQCT